MRKVLTLMLCLAMLATVFAGCNPQTSDTTGTGTSGTTKSTTTAAPTTGSTGESSLINMDSLVPVTNEPVEMTMAVTVGPMNEKPEDMWFFKYFAEQTNVQWNFLTIQSAAWAERKPIMLATDEYPDVFFGQSFTSGEIFKFGQEGIFVPLNDHVDQYGDVIKEKMELIEGSWTNVTCPDGNIYGLPSLTLAYYFTNNRSWINKAWLDTVGQQVPTTLDEFHAALTAFKDGDANGNGDASDEIPWSGSWDDSQQRMMMLNAFGFATSGNLADNIALDYNREAVYIPLTDEYVNYLKFMNKCYTDGLLDQDIFAQDDTQFKAKAAEGIIGTAAYAAPFLMDPENHMDWVALAMVSEAGRTPVTYKGHLTTIGKYIVTDKCEYPDVAVRWANLFYAPEYAFYIMYGPEYGTDQDPDGIGTTIELDEQGNYKGVLTPGFDDSEMTLWDYYAQNHPVYSNYNFGIDDSYIFNSLFKGRPKNVEELTASHKKTLDSGEGNINEAWWRYNNLITAVPYATYGYPISYFTEDVQAKIDELKTPLEDYVKMTEAKFITGSMSIEGEYDDFLAELEKLGATEYQQIYVDAYNG